MKTEGGWRTSEVPKQRLPGKPLVTIITVVFNGATTLEDTIHSVLQQTYDNIEYIIIDGGSSDGTLDIIRKYDSQLDYWLSEPDAGIYDAMNKGLSLCTGDVVGFLNADDLYSHRKVLASVASTFRGQVGLQTCFGDLAYVDKLDTRKIVRYWRSGTYRQGIFQKGWVPPHPTFFAKRSTYLEHGGFNLSYSLAADFELMLRFLEARHLSTAYIPQVLVRMRMGGATNRSISNVIQQNREIIRVFKENDLPSPNLLVYFGAKAFNRLGQYLSRYRKEPV